MYFSETTHSSDFQNVYKLAAHTKDAFFAYANPNSVLKLNMFVISIFKSTIFGVNIWGVPAIKEVIGYVVTSTGSEYRNVFHLQSQYNLPMSVHFYSGK